MLHVDTWREGTRLAGHGVCTSTASLRRQAVGRQHPQHHLLVIQLQLAGEGGHSPLTAGHGTARSARPGVLPRRQQRHVAAPLHRRQAQPVVEVVGAEQLARGGDASKRRLLRGGWGVGGGGGGGGAREKSWEVNSSILNHAPAVHAAAPHTRPPYLWPVEAADPRQHALLAAARASPCCMALAPQRDHLLDVRQRRRHA